MIIIPVALIALQSTMAMVTFLQFIEEEAIQACSLGVYMAMIEKQYSLAWKGIVVLEAVLIPHLEALNLQIGWIYPPTMCCFFDFVTASEMNVKIMMALATKKPKIE